MQLDKEHVKTLALAIGVTAAAKQLGLSQTRVRKWSSRYHWFDKGNPRKHQIATSHDKSPATSQIVTSPSEALANQLKEDSEQTRLGLSKAARSAAKTFSRAKGGSVIRHAQELRHVTAAASTLHGWEQKADAGQINLNVGIMLGGMQP